MVWIRRTELSFESRARLVRGGRVVWFSYRGNLAITNDDTIVLISKF